MSSLEILDPSVLTNPTPAASPAASADPNPGSVRTRLPRWLKRTIPIGGELDFTDHLINDLGLETVCREAQCPNRTECWSRKTATFMILGRICTRPCGFCAVERGRPQPLADDEPARLAEAVRRLGLKHVVITSVTRDDLPDGGADHFRRCILAVREKTHAAVEVLTPDFDADPAAIDMVLAASPEVFNHNIETVARLQTRVRRKAAYETSLAVLRHVKQTRPDIATKSGIMLGLGETIPELFDTLGDLRDAGCDILTVGQYLQPSAKHLPVERFLHPDEYTEIGRLAEKMGFRHVASGPFVRSSYHADEAWLLASGGSASAMGSANAIGTADRPIVVGEDYAPHPTGVSLGSMGIQLPIINGGASSGTDLSPEMSAGSCCSTGFSGGSGCCSSSAPSNVIDPLSLLGQGG